MARNLSSNFLQNLAPPEVEQLFPEALHSAQPLTVVRNPWNRLLSSFRHQDHELTNYHRYKTHQELSEQSLSDYFDLGRWFLHHNPAWRPALELPAAELQALEQRARWLYAADGHACGYNR